MKRVSRKLEKLLKIKKLSTKSKIPKINKQQLKKKHKTFSIDYFYKYTSGKDFLNSKSLINDIIKTGELTKQDYNKEKGIMEENTYIFSPETRQAIINIMQENQNRKRRSFSFMVWNAGYFSFKVHGKNYLINRENGNTYVEGEQGAHIFPGEVNINNDINYKN